MKKADIILIIGLPIIFVIGFALIAYPIIELLDVETITKVSGIYEEPFYLTFHWVTDDEIQVGKLITLDIEVKGLPYNKNMSLNKIIIKFEETHLNYWFDEKDPRQKNFIQGDSMLLYPDWEKNIFKSDKMNLRFIVPTDIFINFCDFNIEPTCHKIENIIHPAPYDVANRIQSMRAIITVSLVAASLTTVVAWSRLRDSKNS